MRLTVFLARLMGLFSVIIMAVLFLRGSDLTQTLLANAQAVFIMGLIAVGIGLAIIIGHNVWSGGALPVVVTIIGWLILAKGLLLLSLAPATVMRLFDSMGYAAHAQLFLIPGLLLGVCMCWAGFATGTQYR